MPTVPLLVSPDTLTPAAALRALQDGNARFVAGRPTPHDVLEALRTTASGQAPFVAVLSCMDSRVPVETVFDLTIGHAFSVRLAGNVVNDDVIGGMEFACLAAGARLIVVMGHTACGAVRGAVEGVEMGKLTGLLARIRPAVEATDEVAFPDPASRVDAAARENVRRSCRALLDGSPLLRERVDAGEVGLAGAMYDVRTGRVEFLDAEFGPTA